MGPSPGSIASSPGDEERALPLSVLSFISPYWHLAPLLCLSLSPPSLSLSLSLSLSRSRDTLSLPDLDHLPGFSGIKRSNLHWVQNVG